MVMLLVSHQELLLIKRTGPNVRMMCGGSHVLCQPSLEFLQIDLFPIIFLFAITQAQLLSSKQIDNELHSLFI
jgi:hypothetical protein